MLKAFPGLHRTSTAADALFEPTRPRVRVEHPTKTPAGLAAALGRQRGRSALR